MVREAKLLETKAKNLPVRELEAALDAGYGISMAAGDAKVRHYALLFDADAAQWVANEEWHPQQKAHHPSDGRYELQVPHTDATELAMDIPAPRATACRCWATRRWPRRSPSACSAAAKITPDPDDDTVIHRVSKGLTLATACEILCGDRLPHHGVLEGVHPH